MAQPRTKIAERAWELEKALERLYAGRPVTAIRLGPALGIEASNAHESVRRRVREAAKYARDRLGVKVCANDGRPEDCGYWLARSPGEWNAYRAARKKRARFVFVADRLMREAVSERANRQLRLAF